LVIGSAFESRFATAAPLVIPTRVMPQTYRAYAKTAVESVSGTQLQLALQFLGLCRQADGDLLEAKRRLPMRAVARQFDAGLCQFA